MKSVFFATICTILFAQFACNERVNQNKVNKAAPLELDLKATSDAFNQYWYNGLAELNSFELSQARYGEVHQGELVMIFVSEDFLVEKQVKKERSTDKKAISVLKMNIDREFTTGIYDYSMMSSVFTPITEHQWQKPIKVSTSSQEWCGHSWTQLNQISTGYDFKQYSYFESEADQQFELGKVLIEDGIWNQIRLNPEQIDTGKSKMLPSTQYIRFSHIDAKPYDMKIIKKDYMLQDMPGENLKSLTLNYPELNRSLEIIYEAAYPHMISGFKDSRKNNQLVTTAKRKASIRLDYWNKNGVQDSSYRKSLKLKP